MAPVASDGDTGAPDGRISAGAGKMQCRVIRPARPFVSGCMDRPLTLPACLASDTAGGLSAALAADKIGPIMERANVQGPEFSEMTEALLAVRDRRDRQAFGRLFEHFAPKLKAMLIRTGLRDGTAEDVVQDVMLAVWHKAAQFDPHRAEASSWIYRIARNRQIDLARRRPLPQPEEVEDQPDLEPDAAQILAFRQESSLLHAALGQLSEEQRRTIRQAYIEDLPHSRISEITGLPLGTVKSRIRLGLERLRHELRALKP